MEHILPASATHPVTEEGYAVVYIIVCERKLNAIVTTNYVCGCAWNWPDFFPQIKNKPLDEVPFEHLFLSIVQSWTVSVCLFL